MKKITWLQACFLGDVKVIWCKSLCDSLFQTYVMNIVEIVIDYYLHVTSHVSYDVTSCTDFTNYSFLSFVHEIVCKLVWPSKIIFLWCLMQNMFKGCQKLWFWWLKTLFWSSRLKTHVFEKHLNSFSYISFMKLLGLSYFYVIFCNFSKIQRQLCNKMCVKALVVWYYYSKVVLLLLETLQYLSGAIFHTKSITFITDIIL